MAYTGLNDFVDTLERKDELIRVRDYVNPELEITEIADRISKSHGGGKALLFENTGTQFPLLINTLGSEKRMALALGIENLASVETEMAHLFRKLVTPKENLWDKLRMLPYLKEVSSWMPVRSKGSGTGKGKCREVIMDEPDLYQLPILKCWPADSGRFITLPAVHTVDPETGAPNLGMYRMQIFEKNLTGMHWHRHKTGANHFAKYKSLGRKMPVTVTLGGDPSYIYAATAPMPENIDEYLLAGFLRKKRVTLVKCRTNDLYIPEDVDFAIEGFVDPGEELILEGPFGDHTGFYSLADYYPRFHVTCITHRKDAVYPATIVGIPPMEDAWIGKATERIFLFPMRLALVPEIADMDMPFAGVAHNLVIVKINKSYPGQAIKVINALWGAGQMMFNKILVVVDGEFVPLRKRGSLPEDDGEFDLPWENSHQEVDVDLVPLRKRGCQPQDDGGFGGASSQQPAAFFDIHDYGTIVRLFTENFDPSYSLHFSKGPLDILDHSSQKFAFGSKLGIDLTRPFPEEMKEHPEERSSIPFTPLEMNIDIPSVSGTRNLLSDLSLPALLLTVNKNDSFNKAELIDSLVQLRGIHLFKAVLLFNNGADLNDLFMLTWLLGGNLEPGRDISILSLQDGSKVVLVDATFKTLEHDHFHRDWPNIVTMDDQTIDTVDRKWQELGLGELIPSPSLKYKVLVHGAGAIREL
jgi:4-hydroxy-3-polyprenylbenzoate decarboxylase